MPHPLDVLGVAATFWVYSVSVVVFVESYCDLLRLMVGMLVAA